MDLRRQAFLAMRSLDSLERDLESSTLFSVSRRKVKVLPESCPYKKKNF